MCNFGNWLLLVDSALSLMFEFKLDMLDVNGVGRFNAKFENSLGSYFSPIFSRRLKSSSNIDFFVKNDFKMSDGFTSFTSSSRNLCRLENVVVAGDDVDDSLNEDCLPVAFAAHRSNSPSIVLMRSSNNGLEPSSASLGLELCDCPMCGLSGGCSIGCAGCGWSNVAVSTALIFGSVDGTGWDFGNRLLSCVEDGVDDGADAGGGGGMGCGCCGGCGALGNDDDDEDDDDDDEDDDDDNVDDVDTE